MSYCGYLITLCFPHRHYDVDGLQAMGTTPGIALLLTAILWLLFVEALQVPLPVGTFSNNRGQQCLKVNF